MRHIAYVKAAKSSNFLLKNYIFNIKCTSISFLLWILCFLSELYKKLSWFDIWLWISCITQRFCRQCL